MDIDTIMNLVNNDNNLSSEQKQELNQAENKQKLEKLLSSVAGSAIGLVVAKFNDLSKTTQVLLTLLGFGLGSVIYDYYHRSKFANYDDKTRTYKIDTDKY